MKGGALKIEISKVSGSALATEIYTGPHNRLLRRQHCSSLCSQSEGHEHVANMTSALEHDFVGFSARAWPPQYSPPHFASKVSYSASPQSFVAPYYLAKNADFFEILNTLPFRGSCAARTLGEGLKRSTVAHFASKVSNNAGTATDVFEERRKTGKPRLADFPRSL